LRKKVLLAALDPTQFDPSRFWVGEAEGKVVACGQLRPFGPVLELGSLVVDRPWRGRGVGSAIVDRLISQADRPLYLECLGENLPRFYRRFGFVEVSWADLPPSLQENVRLRMSHWGRQWLGVAIAFMHYAGVPGPTD